VKLARHVCVEFKFYLGEDAEGFNQVLQVRAGIGEQGIDGGWRKEWSLSLGFISPGPCACCELWRSGTQWTGSPWLTETCVIIRGQF
jgi:hypothetical protein